MNTLKLFLIDIFYLNFPSFNNWFFNIRVEEEEIGEVDLVTSQFENEEIFAFLLEGIDNVFAGNNLLMQAVRIFAYIAVIFGLGFWLYDIFITGKRKFNDGITYIIHAGLIFFVSFSYKCDDGYLGTRGIDSHRVGFICFSHDILSMGTEAGLAVFSAQDASDDTNIKNALRIAYLESLSSDRIDEERVDNVDNVGWLILRNPTIISNAADEILNKMSINDGWLAWVHNFTVSLISAISWIITFLTIWVLICLLAYNIILFKVYTVVAMFTLPMIMITPLQHVGLKTLEGLQMFFIKFFILISIIGFVLMSYANIGAQLNQIYTAERTFDQLMSNQTWDEINSWINSIAGINDAEILSLPELFARIQIRRDVIRREFATGFDTGDAFFMIIISLLHLFIALQVPSKLAEFFSGNIEFGDKWAADALAQYSNRTLDGMVTGAFRLPGKAWDVLREIPLTRGPRPKPNLK